MQTCGTDSEHFPRRLGVNAELILDLSMVESKPNFHRRRSVSWDLERKWALQLGAFDELALIDVTNVCHKIEQIFL
jgi:hypothetical protein